MTTFNVIEIANTDDPETVTIPSPVDAGEGAEILVKDTSGASFVSAITVTPSSGLIDGAASVDISSANGFLMLRSDGVQWLVVGSSSGSGSGGAADPWGSFKPSGIWIPAGVVRDGYTDGFVTDDSTYYESGGTPSMQWIPYLFAYPEVMPFNGSIDGLAHYFQGGGTHKFWIGVAENIEDANGNPYPGDILDRFSYTHATGFDGNLLRSGSVDVALNAGDKFWIVYQANEGNAAYGFRPGTAFRNVFGNSAPTSLSSRARPQIGWVTSAAATYDATLVTFPAAGTEMLTVGSKGYQSGPSNTEKRPSVYFKLAR